MLRKVRRAFGSCRNLDVTIKLTEGKLSAAATASQRQAWEQVRLWLEQKRAAEIDRGRAQLKRYDLTEFIARVQEQIENIDAGPEAVARLWDDAREALADWKDAFASAKENPQIDQIHAFRIAGKRLRYRAESIVEVGDASVKPLVQSLKALQDDLGDCHDRSVLRELVAEFIGRRGFLAEEPGMGRTLLLDMEREKQREHAAINEAMAKAEKLAEHRMERDAGEAPPGEADQAQ